MFMHDHVQVTLLSTEIWLRKGPSGQSPKSAIWRPYWIGPKFYLTCIKVLSQVLTVPNMNEIHSFMSENRPRAEWFLYVKYMENKISHLAAILDQHFKMMLCASMGHYRQCSCMTISRSQYRYLTAKRSILTKSKIGHMAAILDWTKILLDVHQGPITGNNCAQYESDPFVHV